MKLFFANKPKFQSHPISKKNNKSVDIKKQQMPAKKADPIPDDESKNKSQ